MYPGHHWNDSKRQFKHINNTFRAGISVFIRSLGSKDKERKARMREPKIMVTR